VWEVESAFIHITVVPTAIFRSPGTNARFPSDSAPVGITTEDEEPTGVGAGDGVGDGDVGDDDEPPPQAIANAAIAETTARRNDNI
jgi:hypothetical protein